MYRAESTEGKTAEELAEEAELERRAAEAAAAAAQISEDLTPAAKMDHAVQLLGSAMDAMQDAFKPVREHEKVAPVLAAMEGFATSLRELAPDMEEIKASLPSGEGVGAYRGARRRRSRRSSGKKKKRRSSGGKKKKRSKKSSSSRRRRR